MHKLLLLCLAVLCLGATTCNAQKKVLQDKNGQVLRGTPMIIAKAIPGNTRFAQDRANWVKMRDEYHLNTIRLCWLDPWYKDRGLSNYTIDEAIREIDKAVQHAQPTGMNVIINYHNTGEKNGNAGAGIPKDLSRNQAYRENFWRRIAMKYKNNDRVFFELSNEPVFNTSDYINPTFLAGLQEVYSIVRFEAPNRQIILWSFNNGTYDWRRIINEYNRRVNIDWSKTSVGYHAYDMGGTLDKPRDIDNDWRVICTEFDYDGTRNYVQRIDGFVENAESLERTGHPWIDWRDWGASDNFALLNRLRSDAQNKGYAWWTGGGGGAPIGQYIWLRKTGGDRRYVTGERNTGNLIVRGTRVDWWEKFRVERHPNGGVALRAQSNGKYVQVIGRNTDAAMRNNGAAPRSWEQFEWIAKGNNQVLLKSMLTGKYVQAPHNTNNTPLYCRGNGPWAWETFDWGVTQAGGSAGAGGGTADGVRQFFRDRPDRTPFPEPHRGCPDSFRSGGATIPGRDRRRRTAVGAAFARGGLAPGAGGRVGLTAGELLGAAGGRAPAVVCPEVAVIYG